MRANHTPHLRAVRMRRIRRRFYIKNGAVVVRFIKIIPPPLPERCRWCGKEEANPQGLCIDCFQIWRGQNLPHPAPKQPETYDTSLDMILDEEITPETAEQWAASISPPSPPWPAPGGAA